MKKFCYLLCMLLTCMVAVAQTRTVTGTVVYAETDEPLVGVTVIPVGGDAGTGTTTDLEGHFRISVPATVKQLRVSYVGMETQLVAVSNKPVFVRLQSTDNSLDEVIVVAYGTAKKSSFTGSADNIDSEKLELRPLSNVVKGIEGQASGVQMSSGGGQPGSSPSIRIRGYGSINASSTPLYVVDGIPFDGDLASLNPNDIESMTILKDASAGALYGARGANGVVMITTKRGKEGKASVTWRSTAGWSSRATKQYDLVDQKEFVQLTYEALRNGYVYNNGYAWADAEAAARNSLSRNLGGELYNPFKNYTWDQLIDPATGYVRSDAQSAWDENWFDAIKKDNAFRHEHQFAINGGTDRTKYLFSLGYLSEDGILQTTDFERYSARANIETKVNDWFSASINTNLAHTDTNYLYFDGSSISNVWYSAQFISPLFPMYMKNLDGTDLLDADGNRQFDYGENGRPGSYNDFNPLGGLVDDKSSRERDSAGLRTGMVFGSDKDNAGWAKGLKLAVNFGMDYNTTNSMLYYNMYHGNQRNANGLIYKYSYKTLSYTFNQILTWNRSFGLHNFDVMLGHEWYAYKQEYLEASRSNLVDGIYEVSVGTTMQSAESYTDKYRINSYFGRLNYNFDDKYYFSASLRSDASSRFFKENNTGTFWSIGANWRISKENFMADVDWVDNLNVKVSYGEQGNDDILDADGYSAYYLWQSLYQLGYNNGTSVGAVQTQLENKQLSWEKNQNLNVGVEGAFFDNRVRLSLEYYNKKTTDMLLSYPMATSTGFDGYNANVGDMRNQGFEFEISGTPVRTRDFEWNLTFMGATVKNKVLKLTEESPEIVSGYRIIKEGYELNTFYMPKSAGVDPATGAQLYWVYVDDNGNEVDEYISADYTKAANSKYFMGSRIPDLYGSIATDLRYKDFDLSLLTTYSIGGKVYDSLYYGSMDVMYYNQTWNKNALRRWQKPGDVTDVPRIEVGGHNLVTDKALIDASYFAIKNITLGYNLPRKWMRSAGIDGIRVFGSVDNLALFTHLDGMDPQYNFSGDTDYTYAPNRIWSLGFEVKF